MVKMERESERKTKAKSEVRSRSYEKANDDFGEDFHTNESGECSALETEINEEVDGLKFKEKHSNASCKIADI